MNLCRPDNRKSCAACCGLYNVADGTRSALTQKLGARTALFAAAERSVKALIKYEDRVRELENGAPLDPAIHDCKFTGFLDEERRIVGCLLHPLSPGNGGVDFRGLCYYGSVACKSFFCPAWDEIDRCHREILAATIDDWHLYGLVVTDVSFVRSVFGLLEESLGHPLDGGVLFSSRARGILAEIVSWKNDWPLRGSTSVRQSLYYARDAAGTGVNDTAPHVETILESLRFTFGIQGEMAGAEEFIVREASRFADSYRGVVYNNI